VSAGSRAGHRDAHEPRAGAFDLVLAHAVDRVLVRGPAQRGAVPELAALGEAGGVQLGVSGPFAVRPVGHDAVAVGVRPAGGASQVSSTPSPVRLARTFAGAGGVVRVASSAVSSSGTAGVAEVVVGGCVAAGGEPHPARVSSVGAARVSRAVAARVGGVGVGGPSGAVALVLWGPHQGPGPASRVAFDTTGAEDQAVAEVALVILGAEQNRARPEQPRLGRTRTQRPRAHQVSGPFPRTHPDGPRSATLPAAARRGQFPT